MEYQLKVKNNERCKDNPPSKEGKACSNLRQHTDILLEPVDKGPVVVVLSKEGYIERLTKIKRTTFSIKPDIVPP